MISIIVPVYNVLSRLEKCIDSLVSQSYQDIEIIIVDDGSTDGSSQLCDRLKEYDTRIKVFHKKNGGLSSARNYGMNNANGEYYMFVDSDDVIHPKMCELLMYEVKNEQAEIAAIDFISFYEDVELNKYINNKDNYQEIVLCGEEAIAEYLWPIRNTKICHGLCNKIYKKELFNGIEFECGRLHEDVFITYQLIDRCSKLVYVNAPYYFYYQNNSSSICNNYSEKNFNDEYDAVQNIIEYFRNRESLKSDVVAFCAYHYKSMLTRSMNYNTPNLKEKIKQIRIWAFKNIWKKNNCLSFKRKIKLYVELFFPKIYIKAKGYNLWKKKRKYLEITY